jgi:enamine deaminase RidA (YjgF/YER057c/UK114 family)
VIARHNGIAWIHAAQAIPRDSSASLYEQSVYAFRHLAALLEGAGVEFGQVIRTWLYLGCIVDGEGPTQRSRF